MRFLNNSDRWFGFCFLIGLVLIVIIVVEDGVGSRRGVKRERIV